jgi:hypothetical protein
VSTRSRKRFRLPAAPGSIQKGSTLKVLLDREAIDCLAHNLRLVHAGFDGPGFRRTALEGLGPLSILRRGEHLARALRAHLPMRYEDAVAVLLASLTPPQSQTDDLGLGVFFYLPHTCFVALYGLDAEHNGGRDPFEVSMQAQYELTRRFTAEFSIRPFLIRHLERTLVRLMEWTSDPDPHVRRLCSEGTSRRFIRSWRPSRTTLSCMCAGVWRTISGTSRRITRSCYSGGTVVAGVLGWSTMADSTCAASSGEEGRAGRVARAPSGGGSMRRRAAADFTSAEMGRLTVRVMGSSRRSS